MSTGDVLLIPGSGPAEVMAPDGVPRAPLPVPASLKGPAYFGHLALKPESFFGHMFSRMSAANLLESTAEPRHAVKISP